MTLDAAAIYERLVTQCSRQQAVAIAIHLEAQVYVGNAELQAIEHDAAQLGGQRPEAPAGGAFGGGRSAPPRFAAAGISGGGGLLHLQRR